MINSFNGQYRFLSNFYPSEVHSTFTDKTYPTVEHGFQAAKAINILDHDRIMNAKTPFDAKMFGRKIPLRKDWDGIKYKIMKDLVYSKFTKHRLLHDLLLETYPKQLVEGNTWHDNIWGHCVCYKCLSVAHINYLGNILMELRNAFISNKEKTNETSKMGEPNML